MTSIFEKTPTKYLPELRLTGPAHGRSSPLQLATPVRSTRKTPSTSIRTPRTDGRGDRFIPHRQAVDMDMARFSHAECPQASGSPVQFKENYRRQLADSLLGSSNYSEPSKILAFQQKAPTPQRTKQHVHEASTHQPPPTIRRVPVSEHKILDAPGLLDDYYLNLLSWSATDILAVALGSAVYLLDAPSDSTSLLMDLADGSDDCVCSLEWAPDCNHLAVGLSNGTTQLWDTAKGKQVRSLNGHAARVGALSWNGPVLSTGSADTAIVHHDIRVRDHVTARLSGHTQEVCGLAWSPSGAQLASGGNDNCLCIWSASTTETGGTSRPLHRLSEHKAAVKALAWCPFQANLLVSGAGSLDGCIKFWNTNTGACLNSLQTHAQVCGLKWNPGDREILSAHGFSTDRQLCLWKYPSMVCTTEVAGHKSRASYLASSPDGSTVVSAGDDETLRFWKVFEGRGKGRKAEAAERKSLLHCSRIR